MQVAQILKLPSMPMASPSYPAGPYRFIQREYLIITYESEPAAIRAALPEPLEPDGSNTVLYEFIRMPDSAGFGDYTEWCSDSRSVSGPACQLYRSDVSRR